MAITDNILPDAEDFARMETELFGRLERSHARQVRRHRVVVAASVVLLASGGIASVTQADPEAVTTAAYCYPTSSTGTQSTQVETPNVNGVAGTPAGERSLKAAVRAALEHCVDAWQIGLVDPSKAAPTTIPTLQPCVRNDQVIAVFPKKSGDSADDFCTALGMSAP